MARQRRLRWLQSLIALFREKTPLSSEEINSVFGYHQAADAVNRIKARGLDIRAVGFVDELTQIKCQPQKQKRLFEWRDIDEWESFFTEE